MQEGGIFQILNLVAIRADDRECSLTWGMTQSDSRIRQCCMSRTDDRSVRLSSQRTAQRGSSTGVVRIIDENLSDGVSGVHPKPCAGFAAGKLWTKIWAVSRYVYILPRKLEGRLVLAQVRSARCLGKRRKTLSFEQRFGIITIYPVLVVQYKYWSILKSPTNGCQSYACSRLATWVLAETSGLQRTTSCSASQQVRDTRDDLNSSTQKPRKTHTRKHEKTTKSKILNADRFHHGNNLGNRKFQDVCNDTKETKQSTSYNKHFWI